jgi:hypothetical protein
MSKHTPTPWYVDPKDEQAILATAPSEWSPTPEHPRWIVAQLCLYTSQVRSVAIANAEFIVTACNAYDASQQTIKELTAALEKISDTAQSWEGRTDTVPYWNLGDIAAAALKKMKCK